MKKYRELKVKLKYFLFDLVNNKSKFDFRNEGLNYKVELIAINLFSNKSVSYTRTINSDGFTKNIMTGRYHGTKRTKLSHYDLGNENKLRFIFHKFDFKDGNGNFIERNKVTVSVFFPKNYYLTVYLDS